jgi:hypothetical protein
MYTLISLILWGSANLFNSIGRLFYEDCLNQKSMFPSISPE